MLIDSHHHLWQYSEEQYPWIGPEMSVLARDFWVEELRSLADENRMDGFVTVQARQSLAETEVLLALAEDEPLIKGVVGWLDLRSPELPAQLDRFGSAAKLKGVRHVVQDEPELDFILGDAFQQGVGQLSQYDLTYDILIFAKQLPAATKFAAAHPNLRLIVDHIAKPTIDGPDVDPIYSRLMRELASLPNVTCKFSGVATEVVGDWNIDSVRPYWDLMLDAFGPSRLMFGSDWPVCLLKTEYSRWLDVTRELTATLSETEQRQFYSETAQSAYKLQ